MTTARLNVLHDARQSQNPAPRSALSLFNLDKWVSSSLDDPADQIMVMVVIYRYLILFNLDRWVLSYYDDPADQIMVMVVITQKAVMMKQLTISHSLTIVKSLLSQIV